MNIEQVKSDALMVAEQTLEKMYGELLMEQRKVEMQKEYILYQSKRINELEIKLAHYEEFQEV